jgi:hypothetical protein
VANASNEAVYEVFIDYRDQSEGTPVRIDFGAVPPGQTRSREAAAPAVATRGGNHLPCCLGSSSATLKVADGCGTSWVGFAQILVLITTDSSRRAADWRSAFRGPNPSPVKN